MPFKLPFGRRGDETGESRRVKPLPPPPRHVSWRLEPGERIELRGRLGELIAWTKAKSPATVRDPDGGLLIQIRPVTKLSGVDIASAALDGALLGGAPPPSGTRTQPSPEPALAVKDTRSQVTFAVVALATEGSQVGLLPGGAINQRLISRSLEEEDVARIRERGPLRYLATDAGGYELSDRANSVLARELIPGDGTTSATEIQVLDNPLPSAWLFAILLTCAHQRR